MKYEVSDCQKKRKRGNLNGLRSDTKMVFHQPFALTLNIYYILTSKATGRLKTALQLKKKQSKTKQKKTKNKNKKTNKQTNKEHHNFSLLNIWFVRYIKAWVSNGASKY